MVLGRIFGKLKQALTRTREAVGQQLRSILTAGRRLDDQLLDEIEETLIQGDVGPELAMQVTADLRQAYRTKVIREADQAYNYLKEDFKRTLAEGERGLRFAPTPPTVILVAGVNGSGKTTFIGKLAKHLSNDGKTSLIAASDTFRAAAAEQLTVWAERAGVDIVKHQSGADPGAVAFDACEAALARGVDALIIDTAGRLHTQDNLMRELEKVHRVVGKKVPGAPHEVLLTLDATTGQNAVSQAREFSKAVKVTGLVLNKLDGTAKGGIVLAIRRQLGLPVKFVGLGEGIDDLAPFDPDTFVEALFE
jgi:fused signal recognition particle receptor